MSGICHQTPASIDEAARWLAAQPHSTAPVQSLRMRYDLTAKEACQAIAAARTIKEGRQL